MKKILGIVLVLSVVAACAAMACPNDKNKMSNASAASTAGASSCSGNMASGQCSGKMTSSECAAHMKNAAAASTGDMCNGKMEKTSFSVAGLNSAAAATKIKAALAGMSNVQCVDCDAKTGVATVCWKKGVKAEAAVAQKLSAAGYKTAVVTAMAQEGAGGCPYSKSSASGACPHGTKAGSAEKTKTL